jgi:hypothetical protein
VAGITRVWAQHVHAGRGRIGRPIRLVLREQPSVPAGAYCGGWRTRAMRKGQKGNPPQGDGAHQNRKRWG